VHSEQPSALDTLLHRATCQPEFDQLRSLHRAVLPVRQLGDYDIQRLRGAFPDHVSGKSPRAARPHA